MTVGVSPTKLWKLYRQTVILLSIAACGSRFAKAWPLCRLRCSVLNAGHHLLWVLLERELNCVVKSERNSR
jgi:hypothetical protein